MWISLKYIEQVKNWKSCREKKKSWWQWSRDWKLVTGKKQNSDRAHSAPLAQEKQGPSSLPELQKKQDGTNYMTIYNASNVIEKINLSKIIKHKQAGLLIMDRQYKTLRWISLKGYR